MALTAAVVAWVLLSWLGAPLPAAGAVAEDPLRAEGAPELTIGPDPAMRDNRKAAFFAGDSLTYDTWHWGGLAFEAQAQGWLVSGARARGGLRAGELAALWPGLAQDLPGVVLIAIGANDVVFGTPPAQFRKAITTIIRLSPRRKIVLVSVFVRSDPLVARREAALNGVLKGIARTSSRVTFADWGREVEQHPAWPLVDDPFRIHLSPEGLKGRALFYIASIFRVPGL